MTRRPIILSTTVITTGAKSTPIMSHHPNHRLLQRGASHSSHTVDFPYFFAKCNSGDGCRCSSTHRRRQIEGVKCKVCPEQLWANSWTHSLQYFFPTELHRCLLPGEPLCADVTLQGFCLLTYKFLIDAPHCHFEPLTLESCLVQHSVMVFSQLWYQKLQNFFVCAISHFMRVGVTFSTVAYLVLEKKKAPPTLQMNLAHMSQYSAAAAEWHLCVSDSQERSVSHYHSLFITCREADAFI